MYSSANSNLPEKNKCFQTCILVYESVNMPVTHYQNFRGSPLSFSVTNSTLCYLVLRRTSSKLSLTMEDFIIKRVKALDFTQLSRLILRHTSDNACLLYVGAK